MLEYPSFLAEKHTFAVEDVDEEKEIQSTFFQVR